jgi:hypothetical protein
LPVESAEIRRLIYPRIGLFLPVWVSLAGMICGTGPILYLFHHKAKKVTGDE